MAGAGAKCFAPAYSKQRARGLEPLPCSSAWPGGAWPGWLRAADTSPVPPGLFWLRRSEPSLPKPDKTCLHGQSPAPVQPSHPACQELAVCVIQPRGVYLGMVLMASWRWGRVEPAGSSPSGCLAAMQQIRGVKSSMWGMCEGTSTCVCMCGQACAPELQVKSQPDPSMQLWCCLGFLQDHGAEVCGAGGRPQALGKVEVPRLCTGKNTGEASLHPILTSAALGG